MTKSLQRVLIMAGGTGGHVFPGLALARYLQEQQVEVHWLGTAAGLEAHLVPGANIPLHIINISGLRGKGILPLLLAPFKLVKAVRQAYRLIKQIQPDVVIGMGGFVSGPGGIASGLLRKPLIIHEQNAKAGLTNKMLAYIAHKILEGFPATFASAKALSVGNPVRREIEKLPTPDARFSLKSPPFRLLIIGGSQGAQALNELIPRSLAALPLADRPLIYHQTGDKHYQATINAYAEIGIEANIQAFITEMDQAYAWADLVICRAGALTVAELCAAGLGAIFVPFPFAVDDHQTANAAYMVKHNAAVCLPQKTLTPERLADIIKHFSLAPAKRLAMANAAYALRRPEVPEKIFAILAETASQST